LLALNLKAMSTVDQRYYGWLAGTTGTELLKPAPDDYLQVWPVSRRVNSSRVPSDDPALIERVAA
jgi:putative SOS response-associated peptidase YedK